MAFEKQGDLSTEQILRERRERKRKVRLIEEVPGVPADEKYFICGGGFGYPYPQFSTKDAAEQFLRDKGITDYIFESFEP
jgi:hypothetical protein